MFGKVNFFNLIGPLSKWILKIFNPSNSAEKEKSKFPKFPHFPILCFTQGNKFFFW